MLDRSYIGHRLQSFEATAEIGRLRFFAKATGQTDPVYLDVAAARSAGYPSIPVPPTFFFCLEMMDAPNPNAMRELLGIDIARVLHGEQHFTYHAMAFAGDVLRFEQRIADIYDKKNGALDFVVRVTSVTGRDGAPVAEMRGVTVVRNG